MLSVDEQRDYRESFFQKAVQRIQAFTLKKDSVIPTIGVKEAFGNTNCNSVVKELDFPYEYSHQVPFPIHNRISPEIVQECFSDLFNRSASFLAL